MKRHSKKPPRRPHGVRREESGVRSVAPDPSHPAPDTLKGRRLWLFRFAAMTLVPLLVLGGAELALRLADYGHSTAFFKRTTINGESRLVENDQFGLRFFPPELARSPAPVVMRAQKPPGRYRIFLLGESAALGDPAPAFGVGRYLQALLRERYPNADFEVVCVAMTAINSHAILPIARECARLDGDLWIIYMGNNEMVGPFGAATVFGAKAPPGWFVRVGLAMGKMRLMQGLEDLIGRWRGHSRGRTWEGMKLFLENRLAPDDPTREAVYRNFRANLEDILRAGERAHVPIVLSTLAVNLKDFAPLASLPGLAAGTNLPPDFVKLAAAAASAQAAGDWRSAIRSYEDAARLVPRHAEIQFRLGQCQLALSNRAAAQARFSQARDNDALPFRADSRLNAIIEEAGRAHAQRGVHLVDAIATMAARSAVGIPGDESFYEHVHFNFDGNFLLARALAETIAGQLPAHITQRATALTPSPPPTGERAGVRGTQVSPKPSASTQSQPLTLTLSPSEGERESSRVRSNSFGATSEWATQDQCERDLGLTDWNRRDVFDNVVRRLTQPPFAGQPDNSMRLNLWRARLNDVTKQLTATNAAAARAIYLEALQHRPADFRLHWNFAEFLEATRDLPGATEEWRQVQSLIPHHHVGHYQVGRLLAEQGRREEARKWLNQAVALRPDLAAGWFELGALSLAEGRYEEALRHFTRARQLVPQNPQIPFQTAKVLSQLKRSDEAIQQVREALQLDPNFWEAHAFLGEELAFVGRVAEAQQEFEATLRLNPNHPWAHLNLGVALFKQGRRAAAVRQFEAALRLDPQLLPAQQYLEQLRSPPPPNP